MNDADIEMFELAEAANAASATRHRRPFDPKIDGPILAQAINDAVTYDWSIYGTVTAVADDYGFAHDDAADAFAFDVAQAAEQALDADMQADSR